MTTLPPTIADAYRGRKVLVVGADGFLGINCVHALAALQADVTLVTRRPQPLAQGFTGRILRGDLADVGFVDAAVEGHDVVFDFVGVSGPVQSNRDPYRNIEEECRPHLNLFYACAQAATRPMVVFCSSRTVYGRPLYLPVDEGHPLDPGSLYAVHKVTLESYLRVFARTHGLRACVLRLSNAYGPHAEQEGKTYGVVNQLIACALRGGPLTIYGDGRQLRDFMYVDDVIAAFLACAVRESCEGQIFNLGGSRAVRLREAAEEIADAVGGVPVRFVPWPDDARVVETGDYRSDVSKLHRHVPLPPDRSFRDGVHATLAHLVASGVPAGEPA